MNSFSIRDIENLCGIRAHTLRVWEQRYQFLRPKRNAGNHRFYDGDDLKQLLRIAFLYHNGHKPSALARLSVGEQEQLVVKISLNGGSHDVFINHLLEVSLDYDHLLFDRVLHKIILHLGFERAIAGVVFPFLKKIGLLWLSGNLVPAQEHFVSAIITQKLLVAIDELDAPPAALPGGRHVILFTPEGEFHEIPLLFMRYLMKKHGKPVTYFGHNTGLEELRQYCSVRPATHLYFHLVTNLLHSEPERYMRKLIDAFPDKQLVVSGCLAERLGNRFPQLRILHDDKEMEAFARGE